MVIILVYILSMPKWCMHLAYNGTRNLMTELQINCSITQVYHTHTQERMSQSYKIIIIIVIIGQKRNIRSNFVSVQSASELCRGGFHYVVSD